MKSFDDCVSWIRKQNWFPIAYRNFRPDFNGSYVEGDDCYYKSVEDYWARERELGQVSELLKGLFEFYLAPEGFEFWHEINNKYKAFYYD